MDDALSIFLLLNRNPGTWRNLAQNWSTWLWDSTFHLELFLLDRRGGFADPLTFGLDAMRQWSFQPAPAWVLQCTG